MKGGPFHRSRMLMSMLAAAILSGARMLMSMLAAAILSGARLLVGSAREAAGGYKSRGHGGKSAHRPTGIAGVRRAARKARNVKANRRAHA